MTDTLPGIRLGIPELTYHSDTRTLSASGAKTLLSDPERFAWERSHGRPPKAAFDLGGVVHALVLRSGDERIRIIDAYDWRTKAAQDARKEAHAAGLTPINRTEFLAATKIAGAVRRHPLASSIFTSGKAEVSLYWTDPETGVACRARVDWLREDMIVDLKTARYGSGTADAFGRYAASYNYPLPAAVYVEAVETLVGKTLPFVTVTVETEPPYLVRAYRYTDADLDQGRAQWHEALREYAKRDAANDWTVPAEIDLIALPAWYAPLEDLEF